MRLSKLIKWDLFFQLKYGIFYVALILMATYLTLAYFIPTKFVHVFFSIAFLTDFGVSSFIFVCAMIYFEKGQGTINAITVTPIKTREYILSKIISLTTTILIIGMIFVIGTSYFKDLDVNYIFVLLAGLNTCLFFILLGIIIATYYKSFTDMLLPMGLVFLILFIPLLSYVNVDSIKFLNYIYWIWPTFSLIKILEGAYLDVNVLTIIISLIYLIIINYILYKYAIKRFNKSFLGRSGDIDE